MTREEPPVSGRDVASLVLRAAIGGTMVAHGIRHGRTLDGTAGWFGSIGFKQPRLQATASTVVEVGAGAALIAGVATPLAASAVVGTMAVAARSVHLGGVLLAGLPLLALIQLWGGVDARLLTAAYLMAGLNLLTIGARMALQHMGTERTIAHVGFDDIPLAELLDPGITVIAQDPPALGELAAQMLLRRIRDPDRSPETVEVPTSLLTRGSGEISPQA